MLPGWIGTAGRPRLADFDPSDHAASAARRLAYRGKRWRIPRGVVVRLVAFSAEELAALETAARLMERNNLDDQAATLATLSAKLRALMRPAEARRMEPDLEALLEAEGLAMRPGPRPLIRPRSKSRASRPGLQ